MGIKRTAEESTVTKLDPGTYTVRCMDIKEDKIENPQYGDGRVIRFILEVDDVLDENGDPVVLDPIANDKLTPKSKLWGWLEAFGLTLEIGKSVDCDKAIGQTAIALIGERTGKDGTGSFPSVESLVPSQRASTATDDDSVSAFWSMARNKGLTIAQAKQACVEMTGLEPKDVTPQQRKEVLASI